MKLSQLGELVAMIEFEPRGTRGNNGSAAPTGRNLGQPRRHLQRNAQISAETFNDAAVTMVDIGRGGWSDVAILEFPLFSRRLSIVIS